MSNIHIEFSSGPNSGQAIQLADRTLVFGRTSGSDVVLDWDLLVSSRHCKVQKEQNRFVLVDLGSTNGTFVNGAPVKSHDLNPGDQITLGKTMLLVKKVLLAKEPSGFKSYANPFESTLIPPEELAREIESGAASRRVLPKSLMPSEMAGKENSSPKQTLELPSGIRDLDSAELSGSHRLSGVIQVRLRIVSEVENGRLFWLNLGQCSTFGRTDRSDCPIPSDSSLSSEHFKVTCEVDQITIEDMQSRSGVWLNGKKISKAQIKNGDHVLAGATEFSIEVQGLASAASSNEPARINPSMVASAKQRKQPKRIYDVSKSQCASGILRVRGKVFEEEGQAEVGIIKFFETIHAFTPLQVLIDFSRISLPLPKEIDAETHSLFEWLPTGSIEKSPILIALDELALWKVLVEEAWGSDAVIGLRSELPREELLARFRELLMGSSHGPEASKGILGFCWPSVLEALMENNSNGFTDSFFADVGLALIEKQGKPEIWQLFGKDSQVEQAMKIGMRIIKEKAEELAK